MTTQLDQQFKRINSKLDQIITIATHNLSTIRQINKDLDQHDQRLRVLEKKLKIKSPSATA